MGGYTALQRGELGRCRLSSLGSLLGSLSRTLILALNWQGIAMPKERLGEGSYWPSSEVRLVAIELPNLTTARLAP
jgi:hypothetical protein